MGKEGKIEFLEELNVKNEIVPITKIAVFRSKRIRKTIHHNEW
jgi:hypothetical protein